MDLGDPQQPEGLQLGCAAQGCAGAGVVHVAAVGLCPAAPAAPHSSHPVPHRGLQQLQILEHPLPLLPCPSAALVGCFHPQPEQAAPAAVEAALDVSVHLPPAPPGPGQDLHLSRTPALPGHPHEALLPVTLGSRSARAVRAVCAWTTEQHVGQKHSTLTKQLKDSRSTAFNAYQEQHIVLHALQATLRQ